MNTDLHLQQYLDDRDYILTFFVRYFFVRYDTPFCFIRAACFPSMGLMFEDPEFVSYGLSPGRGFRPVNLKRI